MSCRMIKTEKELYMLRAITKVRDKHTRLGIRTTYKDAKEWLVSKFPDESNSSINTVVKNLGRNTRRAVQLREIEHYGCPL